MVWSRSRPTTAALATLLVALAAPSLPSTATADEPPRGATKGGEITARRTAFSEEWRTADGGRVTRLSSSPIHWRDRSGSWRRFDVGLHDDAGRTAQVARVGDARVEIPNDQRGDSPAVVRDGASVMKLRLRGARRSGGTRLGDFTRRFSGILPGVTQRLAATTSGLKEELVLDGPSAPRRFVYDLSLSAGLVPTVARDGSLAVRRGTTTVFRVGRVVSYERANPGASQQAPAYVVRPEGRNAWSVSVDVDGPWLRDKRRQWPVVVDPSITIDRIVAGNDVCTRGAYPGDYCASQYNLPWMQSGWDYVGGHSQELVVGQFALPGALGGRTVTGAKLRLSTANAVNNTGKPQQLSASGAQVSAGAPAPGLEPRRVGGALETIPASGVSSLDVTAEVRAWQAQDGGKAYTPALRKWLFARVLGMPQKTGGSYPLPAGQACANEDGLDLYCDTNRVDIATTLHPDPSKRPYLDIYSAAPAQAGSEVAAPAEGKLSSRFVELFAKAPSANVATAKFEYVAGDSRDWAPIPLTALRDWETRQQPSVAEIPVSGSGTNRASRSLVWDLNKTPGGQVDGPIHVRAVLDASNGSGGGITPERNFRVDRKNPETSSQEEVGPAKVDLLTGDVAVTETDADVKAFVNDLQLTRTYHSRGGSPRTTDMFGPGWTSSFEVDGGADMPYRGIYNFVDVKEEKQIVDWSVDDSDVDWEYFDPADLKFEPVYETTRFETTYAVLEEADGSKLSFRKDGSSWVLDEEHRDLKVESTSDGFKVTDADGGVTLFSPDKAGSPNYRPTSYAQPGSSKSTTFQYSIIDGRKRLDRVIAPMLGGVSCNGGSWTAGCRGLELGWGDVTVDGKAQKRVTSLKLRAVDPSGVVSGDSQTIASYEYDAAGRLKKVSDPRVSGGLPTQYGYDGEGRLASYTPAGERAWTLDYRVIDGDEGKGRVRSITRKTPAGVDATTTFVYDVPLSGSGAPNDLSGAATKTWGQGDPPVTGTAVFPPDSVPSGTGAPSSWTRATINYLGVHGKTVDVADPAGNVTTSEYDRNGNVVRELTARNRERALASSGNTAARAKDLDTQRSYAQNGVDLVEEVGPEHEIRRPDGSTVLARERTRTRYDEGKPASISGDQHLVTGVVKGALRTSDNVAIDEQETRNEYSDGPSIRGWQVKQPLATTDGYGTPDATTTKYEYDTTYPLLIQKRMPRAGSGPDPQATNYAYYGVTTRLPTSDWCASGAGLANAAAAGGLLCAKLPDAQPTSGPDVPATFLRYSLLWDQVEERRATSSSNVAGTTVRTTATPRDALGRQTSRSVSATTGRAIPTVTSSYNASTGRLATSSAAALGSEPARSLQRTYDDNGRLSSYTDADGGTTSYVYDIDGRISSVQDPRGTRGLVYDGRDLLSSVVDSRLSGPITSERDADGRLTKQALPGGLVQTKSYDERGEPVSLKWEKGSSCSSDCSLVQSTVARDAQGRFARQVGSTVDSRIKATRIYAYDGVGRLASTRERWLGSCVRRTYGYDKSSNRISAYKKTTGAESGEDCTGDGPGDTTGRTFAYDGVDRATGDGYAYDALGRTTRQPDFVDPKMTTLTYDVDDLVASMTTDATSLGSTRQDLSRDPLRRLRGEASEARGVTASSVLRYADDQDKPVGKTGAWGWERYVADVDGAQLATVADGGGVSWELSDLHGDVVATIAAGASAPATEAVFDEFGRANLSLGTNAANGIRHAWLGGVRQAHRLRAGRAGPHGGAGLQPADRPLPAGRSGRGRVVQRLRVRLSGPARRL